LTTNDTPTSLIIAQFSDYSRDFLEKSRSFYIFFLLCLGGFVKNTKGQNAAAKRPADFAAFLLQIRAK
jgi:hypothetical protein